MSWQNPDVTPVGLVRDSTGAPVSVRRRGKARLAVGGLLLAGGIGAGVAGILDAVGDRADALDDAVARGTLAGVGPTEPVRFVVDAKGEFTIFLDTPGSGNDVELEREVGATVCVAAFADGTDDTVRGSRQGTASDIGGLRSVGGFTAPEGEVEVTCGWDEPMRAGSRDYVVSPGDPDDVGLGVALAVGGVFVAIAGGFVLAWGLRGHHEVR